MCSDRSTARSKIDHESPERERRFFAVNLVFFASEI